MLFKTIKINNLRNVNSADIEPHPRFNLFHGDNGAGKTSVVESLVLLSKGKSFRTGNIQNLIGPAAPAVSVVAQITDDEDHAHQMGLQRTSSDWKARLDGNDVKRISELSERLPLVLFEPNSHLLVSGSPEGRRAYLDWGVFHVKHQHLETWRRYGRALKQRNAALRMRDQKLVESLNPQVCSLGEALSSEREKVVESLSGEVSDLLGILSPNLESVELSYRPGWREERLEEALIAGIDQDMERGSTGRGPHRADLVFKQDGVYARERMSRGEQKVLSAALLLAQARVMMAVGVKPVLLLDDLASEFDQVHLEAVVEAGMALSLQIWVTGTSAQALQFVNEKERLMFHVKHGQVEPSD